MATIKHRLSDGSIVLLDDLYDEDYNKDIIKEAERDILRKSGKEITDERTEPVEPSRPKQSGRRKPKSGFADA